MKKLDVPEAPKPVALDDEAVQLLDAYNKKQEPGNNKE
jgi:hypothetical protein